MWQNQHAVLMLCTVGARACCVHDPPSVRACVVVSPSVLGRGMTPLSTLMPGRMPFALSTSTKGFPSLPS